MANNVDQKLVELHKTFFWQSEKIIPSDQPEDLDKLFEVLPADVMHVNDPVTIALRYLDPVTMKAFNFTQEKLESEGIAIMSRGLEPSNFQRNLPIIQDFVKRGNKHEVAVIFQNMNLDQTPGSDFEWYVSFMKLSKKAKGIFTLDFKINFLDQYQKKFMKIIEWDEFVHENMNRFQELSPREIEIMTKVALGVSSTEMADELSISKLTVDTHRKNIMSKLGINRFVDLIRFAEAFDLV
jgi:DNA-binding CsgD family transcriptional regulator